MGQTPFSYVQGPFYTYELTEPGAGARIYIGRGRNRRAKVYYRFFDRAGRNRYHNPKGHNPDLDRAIAAIRAAGREVGIFAHDHGSDYAACKAHEKELIKKYGRRGVHIGGTLYNRNSGG